MGNVRKSLLFAVYLLFATCFLFVLMDGLFDIVATSYAIYKNRPVAEARHTEYDELLGWINKPDIHIASMYGPGIDLHINNQRFRSRADFSVHVPAGKVRIICSGDSFTLGYGVDNGHTWCQQLTTLNERLETVNMGQGGYGIDQAYLWYQRDGVKLDHDIHVFAFTSLDFSRNVARRVPGLCQAGHGHP